MRPDSSLTELCLGMPSLPGREGARQPNDAVCKPGDEYWLAESRRPATLTFRFGDALLLPLSEIHAAD